MKNTVNQHRHFSLLHSLCWYDKRQASQLGEKSHSNYLFSDLFWTKDEQKTPVVSRHFIPHFISCTAAQGTWFIFSTLGGRRGTSDCCHWAEGWPPSPSYLWAFLHRWLRSRVDPSRAVKWQWGEGAFARGSSWTISTVAHREYYRGKQPMHTVSRSTGPWWNCDENKWGPLQYKNNGAFQQTNIVAL